MLLPLLPLPLLSAVVDEDWRSDAPGVEVDWMKDAGEGAAVSSCAGAVVSGACWLLVLVVDDDSCEDVVEEEFWSDEDENDAVEDGEPGERVVVVRVVRVLGSVCTGTGTGTTPGADVASGLDDVGRSLLWKLICIIGAYRLSAVADAVVAGLVLNVRVLNVLPSHVTVETTVDVAIMLHIWPPMFPQP